MGSLKRKITHKTVVEKCKALRNLEKTMLLDGLKQCQVTDVSQKFVIVIKLQKLF